MSRFRERWLVAVGGVFAVFGIVMAIFGDTAPFRFVFGPLIDRAFWSNGAPPEARPFQAWVYGAWGGTVAGFGLLLAVVARRALERANRTLRYGVLAAVALWFVVDTGASVAYGVWGNALAVNLPAFLALAVPLALGARHGGVVGD